MGGVNDSLSILLNIRSDDKDKKKKPEKRIISEKDRLPRSNFNKNLVYRTRPFTIKEVVTIEKEEKNEDDLFQELDEVDR